MVMTIRVTIRPYRVGARKKKGKPEKGKTSKESVKCMSSLAPERVLPGFEFVNAYRCRPGITFAV